MMLYSMRKKSLFPYIVILILAMAPIGCAKTPSPDDKVLARVSNKSITLKELKSKMAKTPSYYQNIVDRNKKRYLEEVIMEMLLYEEAVRRGLDKDREVMEVVNEARKKILIARLIKNEVEDKTEVGEVETMQFYEANKERFKSQALWRASHILVANERDARDILDQLAKGASFEELAKARSIDATASRGGDVGYFRLGQVVPDFEKACLKLEPGQTSDIVHTQFGYHIIRLTDKKAPAIQDYENVKDEIAGELKKRRRSELFDKLVLSLKEKYNVEIRDDALESLGQIDKTKSAETK